MDGWMHGWIMDGRMDVCWVVLFTLYVECQRFTLHHNLFLKQWIAEIHLFNSRISAEDKMVIEQLTSANWADIKDSASTLHVINGDATGPSGLCGSLENIGSYCHSRAHLCVHWRTHRDGSKAARHRWLGGRALLLSSPLKAHNLVMKRPKLNCVISLGVYFPHC